MHRILTTLLGWFAALALCTAPAFAAEPQANRDYTPIVPAQPTQAPAGKIEVVEFFSYGCPHCSDFHPTLSAWAAKLPADVSFRRVPISFSRPAWARLAKIYYALEMTGNLAKLDGAVFHALHEQRMNFATDEAVIDWAAGKGIDRKKFADAMTSFGMQSQVARGDQEAAANKISGVPALVVDGRFLAINGAATSFDDLLKITDALIDKARKEKRK